VVRVSADAVVDAPPAVVYGLIADYRHGHPRILPEPYFQDIVVERGGVGAGTAIRFKARLLGVTRELRATVTEPAPGSVLVETDPDTGVITTFTVTARDGGRASHVTIATDLPARGLRGRLEAMFARRLLPKIYALELQNIARVAADMATGASKPTP
jgi:Polyketide cyclase / dehydrase and lipid transport